MLVKDSSISSRKLNGASISSARTKVDNEIVILGADVLRRLFQAKPNQQTLRKPTNTGYGGYARKSQS